MKRLLMLVLVAMLVACQGTGPVEPAKEAVETVQDRMAAALKLAGESDKLVMVDLYTET